MEPTTTNRIQHMPFEAFGLEHLMTVTVIAGIIAAVVLWGRQQHPDRVARGGRVIAVVLMTFYALECTLRLGVLGADPKDVLPFQLCDVLFFVGAYAYWRNSRVAFEMLFFWTFAGTSHALITPAVDVAFPHLEYFRYFTSHGLLILSACYAAIAMRKLPQSGSWVRAWVALHLWVLIVLPVDWLLDANFMFLLRKPSVPTLVDYLGPWPWYLVGLEGITVAAFLLLWLPFFLRGIATAGCESRSPVRSSSRLRRAV